MGLNARQFHCHTKCEDHVSGTTPCPEPALRIRKYIATFEVSLKATVDDTTENFSWNRREKDTRRRRDHQTLAEEQGNWISIRQASAPCPPTYGTGIRGGPVDLRDQGA